MFQIDLILVNPLARSRSAVVHLPVKTNGPYEVTDTEGNVIENQVTPLPDEVLLIPGRNSTANFDLAFIVELSALMLLPLRIKRLDSSQTNPSLAVQVNPELDSFRVLTHNGELTIKVDTSGVHIHKSAVNETFTHQFAYYKGYPGNNTDASDRASGAYIFRPVEQDPIPLKPESFKLLTGPIYLELQITYSDSASLVQRFFSKEMLYDVEYEWLVGPIPIGDGSGKEYISRLAINGTLNQNGIFYTDANGRQTVERKRDFRPAFDLANGTTEEPVSSNYYPVNSVLYVKDDKLQLTVVNDRSQGGASLRDGELELMIHRRLLHDDAFGVNEALNEEAFGQGLAARGRHYVSLNGNHDEANENWRLLSNEIFVQPVLLFKTGSEDEILTRLLTSERTREYQLAPNVNLLSFEPWLNGSLVQYLVRLEHLFQEGEHQVWSQPVSVSLSQLFGPSGLNIGQVTFAKETTLGGNQWKDESSRLQWSIKGERYQAGPVLADDVTKVDDDVAANADFVDDVTLDPLQIRTFIVEF